MSERLSRLHFGGGDASSVHVADDVAFVASPAGGDAGEQGGEVVQRRVVMKLALGDQPVSC